MQFASSQKGVALITALLIVALATVISVEISKRLQLDIRRTGNIIASDQALLYMMTAEFWSRRILRDDRLDNNYDYLGEDWATEIPPIPVEGGTISGRLSDLQGCFNLNSLLANGQPNVAAQQIFTRLMQQLTTPTGTNLSQAVIDWLDDNLINSPPDGAEDNYYLNLEKPYHSANSPIYSVSELRLIKGFEEIDIDIEEIQNSLCAFGPTANMQINVNTAPEEVIESLAANMNPTTVENIIKQRESDPSDTAQDFLATYNLTNIIAAPTRNLLTASSEYFLLETEARIGQAVTLMYSIIHRENDGSTQVLARSQGAY